MTRSHIPGRHFLQIPGPTNVPDRVLRAIDNPTMDHRGPDFGTLGLEILANLRAIFQTERTGDHLPRLRHRRLGSGPDQHAVSWRHRADVPHRLVRHALEEMAERLQLNPIFLETDWRRGADMPRSAQALTADDRRTGSRQSASCTTRLPPAAPRRIDEVRAAIDAAKHPALLLVDTISSLASHRLPT